MSDGRDWDKNSTPTLAEFRALYEADDNIWWVTGCGHHMNWFDGAALAGVEAQETVEQQEARHLAALKRAREQSFEAQEDHE